MEPIISYFGWLSSSTGDESPDDSSHNTNGAYGKIVSLGEPIDWGEFL